MCLEKNIFILKVVYNEKTWESGKRPLLGCLVPDRGDRYAFKLNMLFS
jgi:hypothetical protein